VTGCPRSQVQQSFHVCVPSWQSHKANLKVQDRILWNPWSARRSHFVNLNQISVIQTRDHWFRCFNWHSLTAEFLIFIFSMVFGSTHCFWYECRELYLTI
jgi:hypothetical protein